MVPNKADRIGASVTFRFLSLAYSFSPGFLAKDKDKEASKLFNFGLRTYFGNHIMQTVDIYSTKGFTLKNNEVNIYDPNIKSFKLAGSTSYIMNENFSFRAIATQDEKQLKSAGSFIPSLTYNYTALNLNTEDDRRNKDNKVHSFDIAFVPAYYYNFVPTEHLFLSAGAAAGLGLNHTKSEGGKLTSLATELNFRGSATYDINDFYFGAHYSYQILNHNSDRSTYVKDNIPYLEAFLGYRFKAPKKFVRKADKIQDKIKI